MAEAKSEVGRRRARGWRFVLAMLLVAGVGGLALGVNLWLISPGRHFRNACRAFQQGDLDAVATAAEALRGLPDYAPHVHLLEGMVLLRQNQEVPAIVEFGYAKDHPDTAALAYALSGEALYHSGQLRDAQRILARAVQLDPENTDARRWLAATYFDIGAMNHAIDQLEVVARQDPDDPRAHRLMGLIYKDFQIYNKAIAAYRESLRRDENQPDKAQLLEELAECLIHDHQYAEALQILAQCQPSAHTLVLEANCRFGQGDQAAARRLLEKALEQRPHDLDALRLQAEIELVSNHPEAAVDVLLEAIGHHPKHWRLHYQLARAYRKLGQQELAEKALERMRPLRQLRERFTEMHEAAMKDPANAELRYQLGLLAEQLDKPDLAAQWFLVTLAMDPGHEKARQALERGLQKPITADAGDRPKAPPGTTTPEP
ncbi:MAG TPA: tetratricopeptide repeat protein [Planctomycetaceae bacterium]|nr:tetratricopeptide repeat protein [Planctomycetaceae bacterium]